MAIENLKEHLGDNIYYGSNYQQRIQSRVQIMKTKSMCFTFLQYGLVAWLYIQP